MTLIEIQRRLGISFSDAAKVQELMVIERLDGMRLLILARNASETWTPKSVGYSPAQIKDMSEGFVSGYMRGFRECERRHDAR